MKKTLLTFGLASGLINALCMIYFVLNLGETPDFENGEIIGYSGMLLSFSLIFLGIRSYRNNFNEGVISFGQAFKIGLFISLIASTVYVITWIILYNNFVPDFADKYGASLVEKLRKSGATQVDINKKIEEMKEFKIMYDKPIYNILITYCEIFPLGLLVSLICSIILKKKANLS